MQFGEIELLVVSGGCFRLDGGNMFGVVPKPLWERASPADLQNRIFLETNCLLIRSPDFTALIDTGYGTKLSEKERDIYAAAGPPLIENLAVAGVSPADVDLVIITHLHFDHAGGCTLSENGALRPAFPRARHVVQRVEWEDATGNVPELKGSYFPDELLPLEQAGLIELIDGDAQIAPGISARVTGGHTRGHQIIDISSGGQRAVYLADLCPTTAHLKTFWTMAYDQFPLDVRRVKPQVLAEAARERRLAIFDHDRRVTAVYLAIDDRGQVRVE